MSMDRFAVDMSNKIYDVVVIGGGPVGLAAAYEVAKAGATVIILEQNNFFNQAGSSGDLARMFRTMHVTSLCFYVTSLC
jgi:sarcosine oxidase / L-pipecolate oxidase